MQKKSYNFIIVSLVYIALTILITHKLEDAKELVQPTPTPTITVTPTSTPLPTATQEYPPLPTATQTPTNTPTATPSPTPTLIQPSDMDIEYVAKTVHGEADGCTKLQKAAVVWCIINRIECEWFPNSLSEVVTQAHQFKGYTGYEVPNEEDYEIARDVLVRWLNGLDGRILPEEYLFFHSGRGENIFTTEHMRGSVWDWSLPNIYKERDYDINRITEGPGRQS